jgi:tRNA modification GTPase
MNSMTGVGDTIAAIATGAAPGGVGVVRVSGPAAVDIVSRVLTLPSGALSREIKFGVARDKSGGRLDEVLAFAMRAPKSFTGEDVAEIHGHGGTANMARLLAAVLAAGARAAEPGEFTRRAFENGKLDLPRAEALLAVIEAGSESALRISQDLLAGSLTAALDAVERQATEVLAEIEGSIDFPEDDLALRADGWVANVLATLSENCEVWSQQFIANKAMRDGVTVALLGEVNVGKSSLLNALVGRGRSLVASSPGTTRDYVEARVQWDGVAVTLVDTAGTRATLMDVSEVELAGIAAGQARGEIADVVLRISDKPQSELTNVDRTIFVRSKVDLDSAVVTASHEIATSAATGLGLDRLKTAVLKVAMLGAIDGYGGAVLITERQRLHALNAAGFFGAAARGVTDGLALEMAALDVRQGVQCLAQMRGREVTERVLDEVFARFCIGK